MTIKNKDGSIYSFSQPNPLMKEQTLWDGRKIIIRNKFGRLEKLVYPKKEEVFVEHKEEPVEDAVEVSNKILAWCLPATIQITTDPLYGDKFKRIKYGKKFKFEMVIESQNDINIVLFTNTKTVQEGAIIYPQTEDKRWWRILSVTPHEDLYKIIGTIADYHPSFAD